MVIKGGSRGSGSQLAGHLLRADTNERVEVVELTGVVATTLPAALREMMAVATGTRCTKPLYHASLNTGSGETLTPAQKRHAIATLERRLGLEGHPRAVVEHRKAGRDHLHVVWSRIDTATMRAVHDGFNYRAHEDVARQLEREFAHRPVQGAHVGRGDRPRPPRTPATAEVQQAARTRTDPAVITAEVTQLWQAADSGKAFAAALQEAGYVLAQGDKRGFCLVDSTGGVHSLARRIEGVRTKEVAARLAEIELASLPTVAEARDQLRQRQAALPGPSSDPAPSGAPPQLVEGGAGSSVVNTPAASPQRAATGAARSAVGGEAAALKLPATHAPENGPGVHSNHRRPDQAAGQRAGRGSRGSETLYSVGIRLAPPAAPTRQGAAPVRGGIVSAAGRFLGLLGGLAGGGGRAGAGVRLGKPSPPVPIGRGELATRTAFIPGGRGPPPSKTPPKSRHAAERPFTRLLGPALGVPQEVIAWAMAAKRKLIAYSDATGEYVATELEHLSRIISGAYLDQGLTVTGKQRQTPGSPG